MLRAVMTLARSTSRRSVVRSLKALVVGVVTIGAGECNCDGKELATEINDPTLFLYVTPTEQQVAQGGSTSFTARIERFNFTGPVTLSVGIQPGKTSVAFAPQVIPAGSSTATITVTALPDAPYSFNDAGVLEGQILTFAATGPDGLRSIADRLNLIITPSSQAGVTLNVLPSSHSFRLGESGQSIVTVNRQGGYTGRVALAVEGSNDRIAATLTPNGSTADSYLLRLVATSTAPGLFGATTFTIRATPEGLAPVTTLVQADLVRPQFGPEVLRPSVTSVAGGQDTITVLLRRALGTPGAFALSLITPPGVPGITGTFSPNPAVDDISLLTVRSTTAVAPGTYPLTIVVVPPPGLGLEQKTVPLNYVVTAPPVVGSYTLAATDVSVFAGSPGSGTLTLSPGGGFTGPVNAVVTRTGGLPTPAGLSISVANPLSASSTIAVETSALTPTGEYGFTVTGSAAGLANVTTTFNVIVNAPRRATLIVVAKRVGGVPQLTSSETVPQGTKVALEATVLDQNNQVFPGATVTWISRNTGVATVISTGALTGEVTGVAAGTTSIEASLNADPTVKATVAITVPATVTSNVARIEIEPRDASITAPGSLQYLVNYFNAAGARITTPETGGSLQFLTSNSAAADISATGLATGRAADVTTITARYLRNGTFVVQDATPLTVAVAGASGSYGAVRFSIQNDIRDIRLSHGYTFQLLVTSTAGAPVTSGVTPPPIVESSNPLVTVAPSEPPPGAPPGYYYSLTVPANATVGSTVQIRYRVTGASGTVNLTIVP